MAMQYYFLIIGAFLARKTVDVILDRPVDYAIDKLNEKFGITSGTKQALTELGKNTAIATQNAVEATHKSFQNISKAVQDSKKMYCYSVDEKGDIYKLSYEEYQNDFKLKDKTKYFADWNKYKKYLNTNTKNCITYKNSKYIIIENKSKINQDTKYLIFSFKLSEKYIKELLELKFNLSKIK